MWKAYTPDTTKHTLIHTASRPNCGMVYSVEQVVAEPNRAPVDLDSVPHRPGYVESSD